MSNTTLPSKIAFLSFQSLAPFAPCLGGAGRATTPTLVNSWLHARIKKKKKRNKITAFLYRHDMWVKLLFGGRDRRVISTATRTAGLPSIKNGDGRWMLCILPGRGLLCIVYCPILEANRVVCVCVCVEHIHNEERWTKEKNDDFASFSGSPPPLSFWLFILWNNSHIFFFFSALHIV